MSSLSLRMNRYSICHYNSVLALPVVVHMCHTTWISIAVDTYASVSGAIQNVLLSLFIVIFVMTTFETEQLGFLKPSYVLSINAICCSSLLLNCSIVNCKRCTSFALIYQFYFQVFPYPRTNVIFIFYLILWTRFGAGLIQQPSSLARFSSSSLCFQPFVLSPS